MAEADCDDVKYSDWEMEIRFIVNIFSAIFASLLLVLFLYIGYQVYKKVKFNDKYMLCMILFLNLELFGKIFYYSVNSTKYNLSRGKCYEIPHFEDNLSKILAPAMLSIAVIINLRNW